MSITSELKEISLSTLEILRKEPSLVDFFLNAEYLPESSFWERVSSWRNESAQKTKQECDREFSQISSSLREQFVTEWKVPECDLHKYFRDLTLFLAGYIPCYFYDSATIPELRSNKKFLKQAREKDFCSFLVIENSEWDGLPLVNAIGAGADIGASTGYGPIRYLLPHEVEQIWKGLITLGKDGFQGRYHRESKQDDPTMWIDWSEPDMLDWLTDYYNEIVNYYQNVVKNQNAMLLYLT